MTIYDNIGCTFDYINGNIVITGPLPGYLSLIDNHVGSTIPYLARNVRGNEIDFEVGVGDVVRDGLSIAIKNKKISASSNNNSPVNFSPNGTKQFYLFVNSANFNTAFNNVEIKDSNFDTATQKTTYLVDFKNNPVIVAKLPSATNNKALELTFKTVGQGSLIIRYGKDFSVTLDGDNRYTKLVSTGINWVELKDNENTNTAFGIQSNNDSFNALSDPAGLDYSFQYKVSATGFAGSNVFWDPTSNELLFGDLESETAKNIIPSSGSYPVVFNQTRDGSDFIVYGTGNVPGYPEKNLYFTNSGKLGINIPSGLKPATVLHIVNTLCKEGIRLENWGSCYPADVTLYQNSLQTPTSADDNITFAQVTFAAKNSSNVKKNFAQIVAKRKSVSSSKGELQILVGDTSSPVNSGTPTIITNPDQTTIAHSNSAVIVSAAATRINTGNSSVTTTSNQIGINAGSTTNVVSVTGSVLINNELKLNYVNQPNSLLSIDSNNRIVAATGFQIPGIHDSFWPYEPQDNANKIGGKDLTWERYRPREISIDELCLTANVIDVALTAGAPVEEFAVGDQIAIFNANNGLTQYRRISDITIENDLISGFTLDQSINLSGTLSVYSTTRGGVLTNKIYSSGIVSDATDIVLSTRPTVPTVFNSARKNIDFIVYGTDNAPAIGVLANASVEDRASGIYFSYATQLRDYANEDIVPFASKISSNGNGDISNANSNAVNFREAADTGVWPSRVSAVGSNGKASFYGTYDQNGNVYEWIEDDLKTGSVSSFQYVCGGSWRTFFSEGLRGYIPTPRNTGLDDIGFRIVSQAGFSNSAVEEPIGLRFVRVDNPHNLPDEEPLYIEDFDNRFEVKSEPSPVIKNNLGVVNYSYNISTIEVTNNQYVTFLNSVATGTYPTNLYRSEMSSNIVGGINRSGDGSTTPYSYSVKSNMGNVPVVFVDYLSSIRFVNWLSNGALSGVGAVESLENGSYTIEGESLAITKNRNRGYYLPTLNEWHKAAYYVPVPETLRNPTSAVTIRTDLPHEYASGQISSLTVGGHAYVDDIKVGNSGNRLLETKRSGEYFNVFLGPDNAVYDVNETSGAENYYNSFVSSTGIQFATSGNITFVSKINPISITSLTPSGVYVSSKIIIANINEDGSLGNGVELTPSGTNILDDDGQVVAGGSTPGPNAGFVYKDIETNNLFSSDRLIVEQFVTAQGTGYYPKISGTPNNAVIVNDGNGFLSASGWFTLGTSPEGATEVGSNVVSIFTASSGVDPATLCVNRVLIGPVLEGFKGSILTHNGTSPATWTPNDFFRADGANWTRNIKRAVKLIGQNEIQFIDLNEAEGGTGAIDTATIESEFAFTDTIALYNLDREVFYVKVAKTELVDNTESYDESEGLWDTENNRSNKIFKIVPPLPEEWLEEGSKIETTIGFISLAYAFSIQKGAYFDMEIEPSAIRAFDKEDVYEDEDGLSYPITRFKPSTANTISIRPGINTAFNKTAEDIDFVIYGYRKTFLNRYEPEWFDNDSTNTPAGLLPVFKVHSYISNSVLGSIASGVFRETDMQEEGEGGVLVGSIASGVTPDLHSKITVNLTEPYKIATLENIKIGVVNRADTEEQNRELEKEYGFEIPVGGASLSGSLDLSTYADLSIGGFTYTSGLIAKEMVLTPLYDGALPVPYELSLTERLYVPNYPLTINSYGQIVSLVPPPTPTAPEAPTNVEGTPKNGAVILTWTAPENNGGSNILAYVIEYSSNLGITWSTFDQLDSNQLPAHPDKNTTRTVDGLTNDQSYVFRVYGINSIGKGTYSDVSDAVTPINLTSTAPRDVQVDGDNSGQTRSSINITLGWTVPASVPAGTSIDRYVISYWIDDGITSINEASWSLVGYSTTTSKPVQNIPIEEYVYFKVIAEIDSDIGGGIESPAGIYRSPGTDPDPRGGGDSTPTETTDYNFGTFIFTGSCS